MIRITLQFAFLTLAAASLSIAADHPDLSGNWKMDPDRSEFGGTPPPDSFTRKIEQAGPSLTFTDEQSSAAGHEKAVRKYTTDGKPTTYQWMGSDVKSAAHWESDKLIVIGKVDSNGTEIVVTSTLSLSADGKTLTEEDKISAGGNDVGGFKLVLAKQ